MELSNVRDDDRIRDLYRAALCGDEQTLQQLLQPDATILANIPEGRQTPLHLSALLGHVGFTVALLNHDHRDIAVREDSCGRTALHLASAEGHIHIVKELLGVNNELCLNRDREGRIPLHYAAMRGRTEVVQELIMTRSDSLSLVDEKERTVFHFCVTYNHLETLETLVKLDYATFDVTANEPRHPIFTLPDQDEDTILHLAIMLKQVEVVRYLLSIPEIRETTNLKNKIGLTALDILKKSSENFKICEIQHMLTKAGNEGFETDHPNTPPLTSTDVVPPQNDGCCFKMFKHIWNSFLKILKWFDGLLRNEGEWVKEMRGNLSLVSTVIATITFQALINPPGGFIQQGLVSEDNTTSGNENVLNNFTSSSYDILNCTILHDNNTYCPGQAIASYSNLHPDFQKYLLNITVSFISSVSVTLLLVSGIFPTKNKAVIWMLSIGMWIALTSLAKSYFIAINLIVPYHLLKEKSIWNMKELPLTVWTYLIDLIVLLITLRFFIWRLKESDAKYNKLSLGRANRRRRRIQHVLFKILLCSSFLFIVCVILLNDPISGILMF